MCLQAYIIEYAVKLPDDGCDLRREMARIHVVHGDGLPSRMRLSYTR